VIAQNRDYMIDKERKVLEDLGNLWESTVDLIERQKHSAQKEGEPVTFEDGRRVVSLTMFLMLEFATILAGREIPDNVATLEGGGEGAGRERIVLLKRLPEAKAETVDKISES
jgi:hypothetical protein